MSARLCGAGSVFLRSCSRFARIKRRRRLPAFRLLSPIKYPNMPWFATRSSGDSEKSFESARTRSDKTQIMPSLQKRQARPRHLMRSKEMWRAFLLASLVPVVRQLIGGAIRLYQKSLSPDHGPLRILYPYGYCRFHPSCSEYCRQSFENSSLSIAVVRSVHRVMRCNPWNRGGIDLPTNPPQPNAKAYDSGRILALHRKKSSSYF